MDDDVSDAALLEAVRDGDLGAYGVLFGRHAKPLLRAAFGFGAGLVEPHDLVAEAFMRVLLALRRGNGPTDGLRPYLIVTMRNLAAMGWTRENRVERFGDLSQLGHAARINPELGSDELAERRWKCQVVSSAFLSLPGRWREVLWALEVDGKRPRELAPQLGMSPNAVSSLAVRAKEGLRRAYLQVQVPDADDPRCRTTRERLGPWLRGDLCAPRAKAVAAHLADCRSCHSVAVGQAEAYEELYAEASGPVLARSGA